MGSLVDSYQHVTGGDVSVCGVSDDHMSVCVHTVLHRLSYEALLQTLTSTNLQTIGMN